MCWFLGWAAFIYRVSCMSLRHLLPRIFSPFWNISHVSGIGRMAGASPSYRAYSPFVGALGCPASTENIPRLRGGSAAALYVFVLVT